MALRLSGLHSNPIVGQVSAAPPDKNTGTYDDVPLKRTTMQRLYHYLVNNLREHFMIYIALCLLLALIDLIWIFFT